jgi:diguanylate cyclase (GGDEF)-like protein
MIWESVLIMTIIDLIIIFLTFFALWNFYKNRQILRHLKVFSGIALVLFGLVLITAFYFADIFTMHILPEFMSMNRAMHTMKTLHLNYYWIISTLGVGVIVISLVYLNKIIFPKIIRMENKLEELAVTDSLTKIYNRSKFDEIIRKEIERTRRYDKFLSIIIFDIDHFKNVNDTYGHLIGDYVLKTIANLTKENIRETDYLIRWGGEEFMIVLPETVLERAEVLADRIIKAINSYKFKKAGRVTVSIGVAQFKEIESAESFIKRADEALYKAKTNGRDKVEVSV